MTTDDMALLRDYVRNGSEEAFATLISRHVNLVYSVALHQLGEAALAEEVTQAAFIILARKAGSLGPKTILSAWLCRTAQYAAANTLRSERRRQSREQEAYMQSVLTSPESETAPWSDIAPLLNSAMAELSEKYHSAIVLRFFEGKDLKQVGAELGVDERTAQTRLRRGVEKLRKFFAKRGITMSADVMAGAISTHAVQGAPVTLAKFVTAAALAKGPAAGGSTFALVKGALKVMAWTKAKAAIAVGAAVLLATGTTTMLVQKAVIQMNSVLEQRLADGSVLRLSNVSFGRKHERGHGSNKRTWTSPSPDLEVEFQLLSKDPGNNPLVQGRFFRQFRCVYYGSRGIKYVRELMPDKFKEDSGGYYGYVYTSIVPRDSRWLWFRIEKRDEEKRYDSWQSVTEFKIANPARPANLKWSAPSAPVTNTVGGMNIVLEEITVKTMTSWTNDIWNQLVVAPTEVWESGALLTNWSPVYVHAEDASGNWGSFQRNISLDPRCIWKLEMDFEPASNFPPEDLATVNVPIAPGAPFVTNCLGVPVTFTWDGGADWLWLNANMPTNRPALALKLISVQDEQGDNLNGGSGSWNQHFFRRSIGSTKSKAVKVALALVPNVHTTFYAQPRLVAAGN